MSTLKNLKVYFLPIFVVVLISGCEVPRVYNGPYYESNSNDYLYPNPAPRESLKRGKHK